MSRVRLRRLAADYEKLWNYVRLHPRVNIVQVDGDPPEKYQFQFQVKSLRQKGDDIEPAKDHMVEIVLPRNYPRTPPQCRMLTPVFHPNIAPHAICVGDHWSAGESLESIVIRIGEMLAYQSYNLKSPLNGEAAKWVEDNLHRLPTDEVCLLPEEDADDEFEQEFEEIVDHPAPSRPDPAPVATQTQPTQLPPPPVAQPSANSDPAPTPRRLPRRPGQEAVPAPESQERMPCACPGCGKQYKIPAEYQGRWVRCSGCDTRFQFT
ncbi:MAG: hypothetical protein KDA88_00085 [Planctomycetaceae bacterium]|nr:hypothetical protein [Planctomycetaceae bacterium]MCB9950252.1 hypothetical protein [Planctomycetaceae bacterium]